LVEERGQSTNEEGFGTQTNEPLSILTSLCGHSGSWVRHLWDETGIDTIKGTETIKENVYKAPNEQK
jgi:hypothetical protein